MWTTLAQKAIVLHCLIHIAARHAGTAERRPGGAAVGVDAATAGERARRVADPDLCAVPTPGLSALLSGPASL